MINSRLKCIDSKGTIGITEGKIYYGLIIDVFTVIARNDRGTKGIDYYTNRFEIVEDKEIKIKFTDWDYGLED